MTKIKITNSLVTTQWLADNLSADNLIILDASMPPVTPMNDDIKQGNPVYIPNARRFDFDKKICDKSTSLPHMMPSSEVFTDETQKLGVNQDSVIVAYDSVNVYSSPRAWWMFRAMGHTQVAVLDGGLPAWIKAGYETSSQLSAAPKRGNFISRPQKGLFVDSKNVSKALLDPNYAVIDARSEGRFNGLEPEPRPGLRRGHMPNAINIPYANTLENGLMSSKSKLQTVFAQYKNKKMIFSCGSGVTACILALAAEQAGYKDISVYDGSWSEWGLASSELPIVSP